MALLEARAVEPRGENRCPTDDVLSDFHLVKALGEHIRLDAVAESYGLVLYFLKECFHILKGFDVLNHFVCAHCFNLLWFISLAFRHVYYTTKSVSCQYPFRKYMTKFVNIFSLNVLTDYEIRAMLLSV